MRTRLVVAGTLILIAAFLAFLLRSRVLSNPSPQEVKKAKAQPAVPPAQPHGTVSKPIPAQRQLARDILEQGLTPDRAKQYFSMAIGPLPGVNVPPGGRDRSDFDGTWAVSNIYQVWDSLTPEQQEAVNRLIGITKKTGASRSSLGPTTKPVLLPVSFVDFGNQPAFDYQALADDANKKLAPLLKRPPIAPFDIGVDYDPTGGSVFAETVTWYKMPLTGNFLSRNGCHVEVYNQQFLGLDNANAEAVVAHEMVHCYQQREANGAVALTVNTWLGEGEATWAMEALIPSAYAVVEGHWNTYIYSPQAEFRTRSYDGIGIFGHLSDLIGEDKVWPQLIPVYMTGLNHQDIPAFNMLIQGTKDDYFTSWGASYFRDRGHTPWTMTGPGSPPEGGPGSNTTNVSPGATLLLQPVPSYQAAMFQLDGNADIVVVDLLTGYGRLHDTGFNVDTILQPSGAVAVCIKQGGCECPPGSPGVPFKLKNATTPLFVGAEGGDTTTQIGVAGFALSKFCKQPDPPQPPAPPAGGGGGGGGSTPPQPEDQPPLPQGHTRGDPHLETFDGLNYDFQVVGEYTLVKSTKDDFLVQVRQVPVLGSKVASMNQAVAAKLNGHRVTISIENSNQVLRVDGKEVLGAPPASLRGALLCSETMYGPSCELTWPDGTTARASQIDRFALNVDVQPASARRGTLTGLLGNFDQSPGNDLVGARGAQLGPQPTPQDINHSLADAWRVKPGASLFDYLPGQSSRTFTDPTFPSSDPNANRLANRDAAEKACREEGITDAHLLDDCILDLAVTNNFAYASSYSHAQRVMSAQAALTQIAMPGVLRTLYMDGKITDKSSQPMLTFQAKQDDVIWIDPAGCVDSNGAIRVRPLWHAASIKSNDWDQEVFQLPNLEPRLDNMNAVSACRLGRVKLFGGTIALRANPNKDELGTFHLPIRFIRPDRVRPINFGTTVDGVIENPAARDIYTFTAHKGDVIRISGEGCDLGRMITGLDVPQGYEEQGPLCRGDDFHLPTDGSYKLIVNWMTNAGPAKYHFVFRGASTK